MSIITLKIDSIFGGQSPFRHGAVKGQFLASQGIDPETQTNGRASGYIMPLNHSKFSGSKLSGIPKWIEVGKKGIDTKVYVYASDGELISYSNVLGTETEECTTGATAITNGNGSGMAQMNDYLVIATTTDIAIFGSLPGSPTITNSWWTSTASLTALTNTTYPSFRNCAMPNHAMHYHSDNNIYICDYKSGVGMIHKLRVTTAGANDNSAYNVLDLPQGVHPTDIASYGTDLAVIGSQFVENAAPQMRNGSSFLFLWDTISDGCYKQIEIPSSIVTAVLNDNGTLLIWGMSSNAGWQLYRYVGGDSVTQIFESSTGTSPLAGAVDIQNGRVFFGSYDNATGYDDAVVYALGYQSPKIDQAAINCISNIGVHNVASSLITALKCVDYSGGAEIPIVGYVTNSTTYGMAKPTSAAAKTSFWHSESFRIGAKFKIREVSIPLTSAVTSTVVINPSIVFDGGTYIKTLTEINNTNYPSDESVWYGPIEIDAASDAGASGNNDFYLRLALTGASAVGVALPIEITVETLDS